VQLYFIRHAQSANNALFAAGQGVAVRGHDPALTELGQRQADCLAEFLARSNPNAPHAMGDPQNRAGFGFTHLYCSLMVRAVATGTVVAQRLGLPLHAWLDWHEEGGLYLDGDNGERLPSPGPGRADFARDYPSLVLPETLDDAGWWTRPFEDLAERPARARRVLAELVARHSGDDRVAVISHGGFYNQLMGALLDVQPPYHLNYLIGNTSITRIALIPEGHYLVYQNRCDHLPDELVTY
jgi:2,3-bisphosphoglycerate-dependent phosphoglycerate mutase